MNHVRKVGLAGALVSQKVLGTYFGMIVSMEFLHLGVWLFVWVSWRGKAWEMNHSWVGVSEQGLIERKNFEHPHHGENLIYAVSEVVLYKEQWAWGGQRSFGSSPY